MARKPLKKKSKEQWQCSKGCSPKRKRPCNHLNELLPKPTGNSVSVRRSRDKFLENKPQAAQPNVEEQELQLRHKLYGYALEDIRIEVLIYRFVYEYTFGEIADLLGIPSRQRAWEIYKTALELLKERGFKLYDES